MINLNENIILNLFPKGTLELNNETLISRRKLNKKTLNIYEIYDVKIDKPTTVYNGFLYVYSDKTYTFYFRKSDLNNALLLFNVLKKSISNNNTSPQSIQEQYSDNQKITKNPKIKEFKCSIKEEKSGFGVGNRKKDLLHAVVTLHDDYILIEKNSLWRGKDRGSKKILYQDISSVDFDKPSTLNFTYSIELTVSGSNQIVLGSPQKEDSEDFYNRLSHTVKDYKLYLNSRGKESYQNNSDADELRKWHKLMEDGIISVEEFNTKKRELLDL